MVKHFQNDESGSAALQYAMVSGLIAVVAVGAISYVGPTVQTEFRKLSVAFSDARDGLRLSKDSRAVVTGTVSREK